MTRLKPQDIHHIPPQSAAYDRELKSKTTRTLRGIAAHALGITETEIIPKIKSLTVGVIPILSGQGVITGFTETLRAISHHLGFKTFITGGGDVSGVAEAVERGVDILLMADDHRFIALDIKSGKMSDNSQSTGIGFVSALDLMVGGLAGKPVLVLGCGPVGRHASFEILRRGGEPVLLDKNPQHSQGLAKEMNEINEINKTAHCPVVVEQSLESALKKHPYIVEATNAPGVIDETHITPQTYIVAPGMPSGLTPAAVESLNPRFIHDPLQTGVAVMLTTLAGAKQNIKT